MKSNINNTILPTPQNNIIKRGILVSHCTLYGTCERHIKKRLVKIGAEEDEIS